MNVVLVIGRLTREPELRYTKNTNTPVTKLSVAVNRDFKKDGQEQQADFFNVIVWKKLAESCNKYLIKGQMVAVKGRIEITKYQTQAGENRWQTQIQAQEVQFLSKPNGAGNNDSNNNEPSSNGFYPINDEMDDDLPF